MARSLRWPMAALLAAAAGVGCNSGGGSSGGSFQSSTAAGGATPAATSSSSGTTAATTSGTRTSWGTNPGTTTPGSTATGGTGTTGTGSTGTGTTGTGSTGHGTTGTGSTGTGSTGTGTTTTVQTNGPTIDVTSPQRASFTTQGVALVSGTVTDPAGVSACTINGNPIALGANGDFSEPVTLTPGLNVIDIEATDTQGKNNKVSLSLLSGQFQPDGQAIGNALAVRLNQGSFDAVSKIAASKLTGPMLAQGLMAKNPLFHTDVKPLGFSIGSATLNATNASFGQPALTLTPEQGDLRVHVEIPQVNVACQETGTGVVPDVGFSISCDNAVLDAQIAISVQNGVVTTSVINDTVDLQNFSWHLNGWPSFLNFIPNLATSLIKGMIQDQIKKMVHDTVPTEVNNMIAGASGKPITQTLLGSTATFNLAPSSISIDSQGLNATVDADCALSPVAGYVPLNAPGSLVSGGAAPVNGGPNPAFYASINQDLMNRAGYAVWRAGLAELHIDGSPNALVQLPSWIPLDMGLLQTFIPEMQGKANASDKIGFVLSPQLPPVFAAQPAPDTLQVGIGDLQFQVWDTTTNTLVLAMSLHLKVNADASINAANTFDVKVGANPFVDVSLASSPLAPHLNTAGIDNFVSFVVPPVMQLAGGLWSGFPLPIYQGLTPSNLTISQDGAQGTFVTVSGDVQ